MGAPYFEIKHFEQSHGLVALSANFTLYGDMSDRMMSIAGGLGHRQEVYSIDECFLDMTGIRGDLGRRSRFVRARILNWIGIPTCVGLGQTKTLAKLANHVAKTAERKPGVYSPELAQVCDFGAMSTPEFEAVLRATELGEVWGIGPRIAQSMREMGLSSVLDVRGLDPGFARRRWSVVVERTVRELQGLSCIPLEEMPPAKQEIACTRSFGERVTSFEGLREALSEFTSLACEKLRKQSSLASQVLVFIRTSPFRKEDSQYSRSVVVPLPHPTADTTVVAEYVMMGLRQIFKPGYQFAKAGVMLLELQPGSIDQGRLELGDSQKERGMSMKAVDEINRRFGRGAVKLASGGSGHGVLQTSDWGMKQERKTLGYTTNWADIKMLRT
jgi:DNA polymerase V